MLIYTLITGQLQENCYLISKNNSDCLIIDPGDDADYIADKIQQENLKPQAIIATHGHFDHLMAAWHLQQLYQIPFFIHPKDQFLLDRLSSTAKHFLGINLKVLPPQTITYINSSKYLQLEQDFNFQMLETPGHTPGSISLFFNCDFSKDHINLVSTNENPKNSVISNLPSKVRQHRHDISIKNPPRLFVGDLIFAGGARGRTDFSYSHTEKIFKSIKKILKLPAETIIYSGHGEISKIKFEKKIWIFKNQYSKF